MPRAEDTYETIDLFYRAALEPELWPKALGRLADEVGCLGTALISITPSDTISNLIVSPSMDEVAVEYKQDWWRIDTRVGRIFELKLARGVFAEAQLFSEDELARDPMRQEFCASHGIGAFAAQLIEPWPGHVIAFSVQRALKRGHFDGEEIERLNWFGRHATRALMLSLKLSSAEALTSGLIELLDRFDGGVFVLNSRREVVSMNASAGSILGDGIALANRRPIASSTDRQPALDAAISSAFKLGGKEESLGAIALPRPSGKRPLLAQALPLGSRSMLNFTNGSNFTPAGALLLVVDPERKPPAPEEALQLFGLTVAEARLAAIVGTGIRRRDAAELLGISEWTARDALKQVYLKLDINSQGELVRLVQRIAVTGSRQGH